MNSIFLFGQVPEKYKNNEVANWLGKSYQGDYVIGVNNDNYLCRFGVKSDGNTGTFAGKYNGEIFQGFYMIYAEKKKLPADGNFIVGAKLYVSCNNPNSCPTSLKDRKLVFEICKDKDKKTLYLKPEFDTEKWGNLKLK